MRKPCENCPWRRDAEPEYWDPDHFRDIWGNCQDDGRHVMLCHKTKQIAKMLSDREKRTGEHCGDFHRDELPEEHRQELDLICQGWARGMAFDAIGVRIAVLSGKLSVDEVNDRDTVDLYDTFAEMLEANRIEIPDRNKR